MKINSINAKKIDTYIQDHQECILKYPERVKIQDQIVTLDVYRLPLNLLFYNVENGRFATDYLALKKRLGRELNSEDPKDAQEIEKMLRGLNPSRTESLKNNLEENEQVLPGLITHDGFVVNGNRRMSVYSLLKQKNPKFGYMNVGRLPPSVDEADVYKIELGYQLAKDEKLDYGPINELLKIRQGIKAGLTPEQVAKTINYNVSEIEDGLERLALIQEYLDFIEDQENFKSVEDFNEHFKELQKYLSDEVQKNKYKWGPLDLMNIKLISFASIKNNIQHKDLRKFPDMVTNPNIKPILMTAKEYVKKDQ
ncbi:MAG: hypothetical protein KGL95_03770, partial [Patescibacteria group bacterium]|nr:hypothetical protein [Patescibacteria group bacterium]